MALLDISVRLHAQGNKWTCPEADAIAVCQNLDEAQLGNLTCADRTGLANSATSRHAVLDMLSITHGSDCPSLEDVRLSLCSHLSQHRSTPESQIPDQRQLLPSRSWQTCAPVCKGPAGSAHAFLKSMSDCAEAEGGHLWCEGEWAHAAR